MKYRALEEENKRLKTEILAVRGEIVDETTDRVIDLVRDTLMTEIKEMVESLINVRMPTLDLDDAGGNAQNRGSGPSGRTSYSQALKSEVKETVQEELKERKDRDSRKNNIVIYNLKESTADTDQDKKEEDLNMCKDILKEIKTDDKVTINNILRLGTETGGRVRPMLITLTNENEKWVVLKNAKNLKNTNKAWMKNIGISKDMTKQEREESKKKFEDLKKKTSRNRVKRGRRMDNKGREADKYK